MIITKKFLLWGFIIPLTIFLGCGSDSDPAPGPDPDPDPTTPIVDKIEVPANKSFIHPGLLHTREDLDRIATQVKNNAEPWFSGYNKLATNYHATLAYQMQGPTKKLIRGGGSREEPDPDNYSKAMNDAAAAYQNAIMWHVTGNDAHAAKAVQILSAWADVCERLSGDSNAQLAAGLYGYQFANAAELMCGYHGWEATAFNAFKQWMLDVFYPVSLDFLQRHNNTCDSHYWANWDLCNIACLMSIGVLCDRVDIYKFAVDYFQEGKGNGNLHNCINHIHKKSFNDDIDLGQLQESGRDQGHSLLCIGLLGTICQIAYNQGEDFFAYNDNMVLKTAEYTAKYNYANLSVPFTEYMRCSDTEMQTVVSDGGRGGERPVWELIYNHYVVKKGMKARYVQMAAQKHRPEGGGGHFGPNSGGYDHLGFGTLMHTLD